MKLRQHRGGLDESLETVIEIEPTRDALLRAINSAMSTTFTADQVTVRPYCFDERIGWNTFIVVIQDWGVYGFTDGPLVESGDVQEATDDDWVQIPGFSARIRRVPE